MKKTSHRPGGILESHISDKGIVPKIQKNSNNSILKRTYNSIFKKGKDTNRNYNKENLWMADRTSKDAEYY